MGDVDRSTLEAAPHPRRQQAVIAAIYALKGRR